MHLTPLGTLAGMPAKGDASSGYLMQHDSLTLMLDAGPGTAVRLSEQHPDGALDAVFISHQHSDHIYDLLPIGKMLLNRRLMRDERTHEIIVNEMVPRVPLFVPVGALTALQTLAGLFPVTSYPLLDRAFDVAFDVHEYEPGETVEVGDLRLRFELLAHVSPNCGVRIEGPDATLVYSGDTGVTEALPALADGADMLLCESTLRTTDLSGHGHLSSAEAGRAAADAGVSALMLTHFSSPLDTDREWHRAAAAAEFAGTVLVAASGRTVPVTDSTASGSTSSSINSTTRKALA